MLWRLRGRHMNYLPGVRMHPFEVRFSATSGIRYNLPADRQTGIDIWEAAPGNSGPLVTTLEVRSGGGKTTLANCLLTFLSTGDITTQSFNWTAPLSASYAVCMLPQRSSTVLHWRVSDLVPPTSKALVALLGDDSAALAKKHLSQLSGGQTTRVLLASAIENAAASGLDMFYLLLDEAFEGLDAELANATMRRILDFLKDASKPPAMRILLISHFEANAFLNGVPSRRIMLTPQTRVEEGSSNDVITSFVEVMVNEAATA